MAHVPGVPVGVVLVQADVGQLVLGLIVVHREAPEGAHLPVGHVLHQVALDVAVVAQLAEEPVWGKESFRDFAIKRANFANKSEYVRSVSLGQRQWIDGNLVFLAVIVKASQVDLPTLVVEEAVRREHCAGNEEGLVWMAGGENCV